jgi:hypothetical protein
MLNSFAYRVILGDLFETVRGETGWQAFVGGLPLIGIAGGRFEFASAASAHDWVHNAVSRYLAGNHNSAKVQVYIFKLEVLRLKAASNSEATGELATQLRAEIEALQRLDYKVLLGDGGGAVNLSRIVLDGGLVQ